MITADTITDEQIRALYACIPNDGGINAARRQACEVALFDVHSVDAEERRRIARARCAELLNARPSAIHLKGDSAPGYDAAMPKDDKPRMGRPPRAGETATEIITVRATEDERAAWERAAKADGESLAGWIRERCNRSVARR